MSTECHFGPGRAVPLDRADLMLAALPRTALPIHGGLPRHLLAHLGRLQAGASALGWGLPWLLGSQAEIETWLREETPRSDAALRLVLEPEVARLSARLEPLPAVPDSYRLKVLPHPLRELRQDVAIVHKGLAGPWGQAVLVAARASGAEDALLLWDDGTLAETAIASVALEQGGTLLVPPPQGRVASLAERLDLPGWASARGLRIEVADISVPSVVGGRLWCMNALRGFWLASLA